MASRLLISFVGLVILSAVQLSAHHSHAATYFEGQRATIEGRVAQVSIRNPHSWVQVNVKDTNGEVHLWAIEWAAATQLTQAGVVGRTLRVGDQVTILGNPARDPKQRRLRMLVIDRASDGWSWGTRPGEVVN